MVRPPGQSDFEFNEAAPDPDAVSHEASAFATRWVMRATFAILFVLLLLCVVGAHIPSGG